MHVCLSVCAGQSWSLFLYQISGRPALSVPITVPVMIMTVLQRTCTHTVLRSLSAGRLGWQHWCVYVPYAPCWFPLWTRGSLTSLLRSPRLTALSCQTNEHARKQRKEKRAGGKKRDGGWLWKRQNERDCEIRGRILIREWSERGQWGKERRLQKKRGDYRGCNFTQSAIRSCSDQVWYDSRRNKSSHCMEMVWPDYQRSKM